ncbi:hypothetical protein THIOKS1860027 [Thiocapsa sp. KS1]|nr:hypothetical protein THIOKS1860027 [Thiocapsa sp. KS1]
MVIVSSRPLGFPTGRKTSAARTGYADFSRHPREVDFSPPPRHAQVTEVARPRGAGSIRRTQAVAGGDLDTADVTQTMIEAARMAMGCMTGALRDGHALRMSFNSLNGYGVCDRSIPLGRAERGQVSTA